MSAEQLVKDLANAFIDAQLMAKAQAQRVAQELVEQEDEATIKDFLALIKETKSEILKELAKQKELSEDLHEVQKRIKHLKADIEHTRFLIELAKKLK